MLLIKDPRKILKQANTKQSYMSSVGPFDEVPCTEDDQHM